MAPIRVAIVDDHPVFRFGLRALIATEPDTELVGEATTGEEAISLVSRERPDVVLMDLHMPEVDGLTATIRILEAQPDTRILVLTMLDDDDSVFAAMRAGALGYVLKGTSSEEILRAIRSVADGEAIFGSTIARRVLAHFAQMTGLPPVPPGLEPFPGLTQREREILTLVAGGFKNAAIANRLFLSPKTIRNNVSTIFAKLQVDGRGEAIIRARDAGLG